MALLAEIMTIMNGNPYQGHMGCYALGVGNPRTRRFIAKMGDRVLETKKTHFYQKT